MRDVFSKIGIAVSCLILGAGAMYQFGPRKPAIRKMHAWGELGDSFPHQGLFEKDGDPFEEMERMSRSMHEQILKQFNFAQLEKDQPDQTDFDVSQREDPHFVYYDIAVPGLKSDKVKIRVENGQMSISGRVENKSEGQGAESLYVSSFTKTLPVPKNVDSAQVKIEQESGKLVVQFPKLQEKAET